MQIRSTENLADLFTNLDCAVLKILSDVIMRDSKYELHFFSLNHGLPLGFPGKIFNEAAFHVHIRRCIILENGQSRGSVINVLIIVNIHLNLALY